MHDVEVVMSRLRRRRGGGESSSHFRHGVRRGLHHDAARDGLTRLHGRCALRGQQSDRLSSQRHRAVDPLIQDAVPELSMMLHGDLRGVVVVVLVVIFIILVHHGCCLLLLLFRR